MFESSLEAMVGVIPVAMTGGVVLGLTQQALRINKGPVYAEQDTYRPRRKARRPVNYQADDMWQRLFGPPQ